MIPPAPTLIFVATLAVLVVAHIQMKALLTRHEAALAAMREQLRVYETICSRGGDAEYVFVRHRQGTTETWVDLVLQVEGLSLRYPIRPDQMDSFVTLLRGETGVGMPSFLPDA